MAPRNWSHLSLVGKDEMTSKIYTQKIMVSWEQSKVPLEDLIQHIK